MSIHRHIHFTFISLYVVTAIIFVIFMIRKMKNKKGPKELTNEKYNGEYIKQMIEVTKTDIPMFNLWPFVYHLQRVKIIPKKINKQQLVYKYYRDANDEIECILLTTEQENEYIVIVVDKIKMKAKGYFKLKTPENYFSS